VLEKSKAPPSLKVSFRGMWVWWGGMPPEGTGRRRASQVLGPKKGAETWVSRRERRGAERDWRVGVGVVGR